MTGLYVFHWAFIFLSKTLKALIFRKNDSKLLDLIEVSPAAQRLPKKGKLFCWVQTSTIYHDTRSLAINETWIHRCDHGQLFTSERFNDTRIPYSTVFKGIPDDYYNLFFKSRYAFHHIYTNISSEFDWYLKVSYSTLFLQNSEQDLLDHSLHGFRIAFQFYWQSCSKIRNFLKKKVRLNLLKQPTIGCCSFGNLNCGVDI